VPENSASLPDFTRWPSFPFEGDMRVKKLAAPVDVEPPRSGEDAADCVACNTPDDAYIWVSERWRVRAMDRPTGLPMVLILECRSHLDLGDLPNLLAAELGVMTVRLERAIRTLDEVARVHVNRWGDGSAHLHMWFLARPYGRLQLRGTFLSLWDDILPVIPEQQWRGNLALVAAWLAEFGGRANAEPPHIQWQSPGSISDSPTASSSSDSATDDSAAASVDDAGAVDDGAASAWRPTDLADVEGSKTDSRPANSAAAGVAAEDWSGSPARAEGLEGSRTAADSPASGSGQDANEVGSAGAGTPPGTGTGTAMASGTATASGRQEGGESSVDAAGGAPLGVGSGAAPGGDQAGRKTRNGGELDTDVVGDAVPERDATDGQIQAGEAVDGGAADGSTGIRDTSAARR
jgi:hypothetical protein